MIVTYAECMFVALVIQHTGRMLRIIHVLSSVACITAPYFFYIMS